MKLLRFLSQSIFICLFFLGECCFQTHASDLDPSLLGDIKGIIGEYTGEIRLQNSTGTVNKLLVLDARMTLDIQNDQLVVSAPENLMGKHCHVAVGGIRELVRNAGSQPQILKAVFDYDSTHCPSEKKWNEVLVLLNQDSDGKLVLETLLTHGPIDLAGNLMLGQDLNVHGFFTKQSHFSISQK